MSYIYNNVEVVRILDGDTIDVLIDVGFRFKTIQRLRLLNYDAPERRQPGYEEARDKLQQLLAAGPITLQTMKNDSFGRWLSYISVDSADVNATMAAWLKEASFQ